MPQYKPVHVTRDYQPAMGDVAEVQAESDILEQFDAMVGDATEEELRWVLATIVAYCDGGWDETAANETHGFPMGGW